MKFILNICIKLTCNLRFRIIIYTTFSKYIRYFLINTPFASSDYSIHTPRSMSIGLLHGLRVGLQFGPPAGILMTVTILLITLPLVASFALFILPTTCILAGFLIWGLIEGYRASKELQKTVITHLSPSSLKIFEPTRQLSSRFTLFQTTSKPVEKYMLESSPNIQV